MKNFIQKYGLALLAIIYILSPIDLLPEAFIPIIGLLDDAGIAGVLIFKSLSDYKKKKID